MPYIKVYVLVFYHLDGTHLLIQSNFQEIWSETSGIVSSWISAQSFWMNVYKRIFFYQQMHLFLWIPMIVLSDFRTISCAVWLNLKISVDVICISTLPFQKKPNASPKKSVSYYYYMKYNNSTSSIPNVLKCWLKYTFPTLQKH